MVWGCVTFFGMGTLAFINGNMNSEKYINTLDNYLWLAVTKHYGVVRILSRLLLILFLRRSHTFSIRFKSGDFAGHNSIGILFSCFQASHNLDLWVGALSTWNIQRLTP
jgi:hypothetical protein